MDAYNDEGSEARLEDKETESEEDDSNSDDPEFMQAEWEDSVDSDSFDSFVDDELDMDATPEVQQARVDEEFIEEARVRSDEENNAVNKKARRVNPPPTRPIYDSRGRP